MRLSRSRSADAALACGLVLTALALAAPNSVAEASSVAPVSHYLRHESVVDARALAQVPGAPRLFVSDFFGPYVPAPRKSETDGLSRNPGDCVYGCIDNGD